MYQSLKPHTTFSTSDEAASLNGTIFSHKIRGLTPAFNPKPNIQAKKLQQGKWDLKSPLMKGLIQDIKSSNTNSSESEALPSF